MLHTPLRAAVLAATVAVALAAPAQGAERAELNGGPVTVAAEASLQLIVPADLRRPTLRVRVAAPAAFSILRCSSPRGWTCRLDEPAGQPPAVEWTATGSGARLVPLSFAVMAPADPGSYPFAVLRTSGPPTVAVRFDDRPGAAGPAPVLEVRAPQGAVTSAAGPERGSGRIVADRPPLGALAITAAATALTACWWWWRRRRAR